MSRVTSVPRIPDHLSVFPLAPSPLLALTPHHPIAYLRSAFDCTRRQLPRQPGPLGRSLGSGPSELITLLCDYIYIARPSQHPCLARVKHVADSRAEHLLRRSLFDVALETAPSNLPTSPNNSSEGLVSATTSLRRHSTLYMEGRPLERARAALFKEADPLLRCLMCISALGVWLAGCVGTAIQSSMENLEGHPHIFVQIAA